MERGARPKQEERAWESWSLGLALSSGLSRPPRESGMREGPPSSVAQRDLRVRGEQGRNAGLERPGHNRKGSRLQRSGTEASVGWSSEGPPDAQPNPTPGPPQGPQQTEPCYANLELQTLPLCEPGQPRQVETEYSTVVSAGAGSPRGDRGRARCVRHLRGWRQAEEPGAALVTLRLSRTAPHREWDNVDHARTWRHCGWGLGWTGEAEGLWEQPVSVA